MNHWPASGYITNKVSLVTSPNQFIPRAFKIPEEKKKFLKYVSIPLSLQIAPHWFTRWIVDRQIDKRIEVHFLAHLSRRLKWAIVIAHRPSSVRPSSSVNFHIFNFSSETAERNSTKLDWKQDLNALYQVCVFRADRKNKMAALASDWLRHFRLLLWNRCTDFNETWQEARSQRPLPSLCFSGR